ncbi:PFL_4669 family integrating conjugative element protein [Ursidibacter sp. B-7004-1]
MTQYNQELGALRSEITLTLHSQYALKLWNGRPILRDELTDNVVKPQIPSMPNCLAILSQIQKDAAGDDPYADWYLIQFEEKVQKHTEDMKELIVKLIDIYQDQLPENIDISRCANINPVTIPIFVNSQLGYKLIYLLSEFDMLARSTMTACHIALMSRAESHEWLEAGASLLRKCFGVTSSYRHSGITRQDVRENNSRYQETVKRLQLELPADVLAGEKRAMFAPMIRTQQTGPDEQVISGEGNE